MAALAPGTIGLVAGASVYAQVVADYTAERCANRRLRASVRAEISRTEHRPVTVPYVPGKGQLPRTRHLEAPVGQDLIAPKPPERTPNLAGQRAAVGYEAGR